MPHRWFKHQPFLQITITVKDISADYSPSDGLLVVSSNPAVVWYFLPLLQLLFLIFSQSMRVDKGWSWGGSVMFWVCILPKPTPRLCHVRIHHCFWCDMAPPLETGSGFGTWDVVTVCLHPVIDFVLSVCFFFFFFLVDVGLVLQSERKFRAVLGMLGDGLQ